MCSQWLPMGTESVTPLPPPPVQPFLPAGCTFLAIGALVFKNRTPSIKYRKGVSILFNTSYSYSSTYNNSYYTYSFYTYSFSS